MGGGPVGARRGAARRAWCRLLCRARRKQQKARFLLDAAAIRPERCTAFPRANYGSKQLADLALAKLRYSKHPFTCGLDMSHTHGCHPLARWLSPMERSCSATTRPGGHAVGPGPGFEEVLYYSKPPICGVQGRHRNNSRRRHQHFQLRQSNCIYHLDSPTASQANVRCLAGGGSSALSSKGGLSRTHASLTQTVAWADSEHAAPHERACRARRELRKLAANRSC